MCFVTVEAVVAAAESVADLAFVAVAAVEAPFDYSPYTDCSLLAVAAASSCSDFEGSSYHTWAAVAAVVVVEDTSYSADWGSSSFVVVVVEAALAACPGMARFELAAVAAADSELAVASFRSDLCTAVVDTCFVAVAVELLVGPLAFDCNSLVGVAAVDYSLAVVGPFEPAFAALAAAAAVGLAVAPFAVAVVFDSKLGIVRPDCFVAGFAASEAAS